MSLFDKVKKKTLAHRKADEALYSFVAQEMEEGIRHNGLWLKALEQANGNEQKQVAAYIKLRVQSLRDDASIPSDPDNPQNKTKKEIDIDELTTMLNKNTDIDKIYAYLSGMNSHEIMRFINTPNACDEFPIHISIRKKRIDLAKWLLESGADITMRNYWGKTPLEIAQSDEYEEAISLLERCSK